MDIVVPPMFLPSPSPFLDKLVLAGGNVSFPCMATGFPTPTFSWVRNLGSNNLIVVNLDNRFSIPPAGMGDGTLTISLVEVSDSNTFVCQALNSNSQGPVNNGDVTLRVINQPTVIQHPPDNLIPVAGNQVALQCNVSNIGGITIRYRWTKDDTILRSDQVNGTLVLPSVEKNGSDNGLYKCSIVLTGNGLNAEPLLYLIGSTLLTVEGKLLATII